MDAFEVHKFLPAVVSDNPFEGTSLDTERWAETNLSIGKFDPIIVRPLPKVVKAIAEERNPGKNTIPTKT